LCVHINNLWSILSFFFLCHIHIEIYKMMIILHVACLSKYFFRSQYKLWRVFSRGGNRAGRVGFWFGRIESSQFDWNKKSGHGSRRVGFRVKHYRLLFRSRVRSGFRFLWAQVVSGFGSFGFRLSRVSSHLISGSLGFRVFSGQVLFCHILSRVGPDFRSSDFRSFSKIYFS
jgi:hypothetical protein